jgi:hypothetical protein
MRIICVSDQHFGVRKNSKLFHDYFLKFYNDVFFPTIEKEGITTVVDMGDTFDSRKGIDFSALSWAKNNYYDRLRDMGCEVLTVVGNHTAYHKNSNSINAVDLLLREYDNVKVFSEITEHKVGNLPILFIPWINSENEENTLKTIKNTKCKIAMGHLELNGFSPYKGHTMIDGRDSNIFERFTKVFSGHYHTRSDNGTVYYIGNPYEIYFNDLNDTRGFILFDTDTLEHEYVNNPYRMHYQIYYEDNSYQTLNASEYENKIVRLVVRKKSNVKQFEKYVEKLYRANVSDLKIIENFELEETEFDVSLESEDTFSLLQRFIDESESNLNKDRIKTILKEIHQEAYELV